MKTNPDSRRPGPGLCRILCSNVRGLDGNLSDMTVGSSRYAILLCFETLVSDMPHVSELLVPLFCLPCLYCAGAGYGAFRQHKFECDCCEMLVFRVSGV